MSLDELVTDAPSEKMGILDRLENAFYRGHVRIANAIEKRTPLSKTDIGKSTLYITLTASAARYLTADTTLSKLTLVPGMLLGSLALGFPFFRPAEKNAKRQTIFTKLHVPYKWQRHWTFWTGYAGVLAVDAVGLANVAYGFITGDHESIHRGRLILQYSIPNTLGASAGYFFMAETDGKKPSQEVIPELNPFTDELPLPESHIPEAYQATTLSQAPYD